MSLDSSRASFDVQTGRGLPRFTVDAGISSWARFVAQSQGGRGIAAKAVTVSREELYRRVWDTPMSRLAKEFGVSGNGLAKICDRLAVPKPPRGYWARKEAGQNVARYRLPPPKKETPQEVTITPTPAATPLDSKVQEAIAAAKEVARGTVVTEHRKRPHPVVAQWLAEHQERKRRHRQDRSSYGPAFQDWNESDLRQHRILDTIFRAVEKNGLSVIYEPRGKFHFTYEGEKIACRLREKNRQVRRPKTDDEKRWSLSDDKDWKQELEPTGNLVFTLEDYFGPEHGIRREWLETDTKRLEGMIEDFVATLNRPGFPGGCLV